jgi:hypothetical protein
MGNSHSKLNIGGKDARYPNTVLSFSGLKDFEAEAQKVSATLKSLPTEFAETLCYHLSRLQISAERLSELSTLSVGTIKRYRTEEDINRNLRTVVLICVGMKLHPIFSYDLIRKAGLCFTCSLEHTAYQMLLMNSQKIGTEECIEYLKSIESKEEK